METTTLPCHIKTIPLPNKETYAYREAGSSQKTLLLLHGNFTTSLFFEPFIGQISSTYRVIAPDLRGYGHTTYNTPISSLHDLVEDLKHFIEALKLDKVNILGWSAGGPVAQLFTCKYPELVESLILVGSVGCKGTMMKDAQGRLMREKGDFERCWVVLDLIGMMRAKNNRLLRWYLENAGFQNKDLPANEMMEKYVNEVKLQRNMIDMFNALNCFNISDECNGICFGTKEIKEIKTPCLLIHGSNDENVLCESSWEIKRYLDKNAKIEIIEGERHFLFEPKTAGKVAKLVQDFLC